MTPQENIAALLAILAEQSGENVSENRVNFTFGRLQEFPPAKVCEALLSLIETSRRFPTVGEIKNRMGMGEPTERGEAVMIVDRIFAGMRKFGAEPPSARVMDQLRAFIGEGAWRVVNSNGGWQLVCERAGENASALTAQIRDSAEAMIRCGQIEFGKTPSLPIRTDLRVLTE